MSEQEFQSKVLTQLERIEQRMDTLETRLETIDSDVKKSNQRLDNLLGSLTTALVATVISASLLILARNAFEFWVAYHPPMVSGS
ncbi:hypothetical protein RIF25_00930 [Thermosynechococcaceae cyanobacterium BACA0444]|uniref:Uncharacterized protein n=1 Tax=Pseudocalidococcus azoricus BACA0444 TaxID=2918990 RepID=A0AAE4JUT3_9CYAN|nr:hypothetical protein [Pseudocalidococcus azoricus]MDS3859361.1 hypothetical protein [Pseudocalidococcus azoricus BACA0444]